MDKFEFKSAICTSRSQSEKLLALGLKKETADCALHFDCVDIDGEVHYMAYEIGHKCCGIPAWSLHRLVEIMFKGDIEGFVGYNIHANNVGIMYEYAISNIEALIKMGTFNKDYLEEKK